MRKPILKAGRKERGGQDSGGDDRTSEPPSARRAGVDEVLKRGCPGLRGPRDA